LFLFEKVIPPSKTGIHKENSAMIPAQTLPSHQPVIVEERIGIRSLSRVCLIAGPTPVHTLEHYGAQIGIDDLMIKREDLTSPLYGGNKVRNLEFVLADALRQGATAVRTLVPYGSNFTAALASEARHLGLRVHLHQFVAQENTQTHAHARFASDHGAVLRTHRGRFGPIHAALDFTRDREATYAIAPGASNLFGATAHMRALRETLTQLKEQGRAAPDVILVGTGTCGNTAGLLAAIRSLKLPTKLIGVRCADPLVCRRSRVLSLASATLRFNGLPEYATKTDFQLVEAPGHLRYGVPSKLAIQAAQEFFELEGLPLDITYTSKVIAALKHLRSQGAIQRRDRVLYWHTYSSRALPPSLK
jgi:1-aminocyclopropane-1-carboxylate deaminase/D-cysteine desulfhydrase-like pyridoxal-dependent ACC family enzyme